VSVKERGGEEEEEKRFYSPFVEREGGRLWESDIDTLTHSHTHTHTPHLSSTCQNLPHFRRARHNALMEQGSMAVPPPSEGGRGASSHAASAAAGGWGGWAFAPYAARTSHRTSMPRASTGADEDTLRCGQLFVCLLVCFVCVV
jgi:hypothetical protein